MDNLEPGSLVRVKPDIPWRQHLANQILKVRSVDPNNKGLWLDIKNMHTWVGIDDVEIVWTA